MLFAISIVKALIEIALFSLAAQGLVALFSPKTCHQNVIFQLFGIINMPVNRLVRWITPKTIIDAHMPFVGFLLLILLWFATLIFKLIEVRAL